MGAPSAIDQLQRVLEPRCIVTDPAELLVYESDGFTIARARPAAVVFPLSTRQVVQAVQILAREGVQIVPRGSGTGLTGGCVAFDDGIIVSTARMTRIHRIDLDNRAAHVDAGVRNTALTDVLAALPGGSAWHFAPDPSSQRASTIGGNAATNAGGIHTLKDFVSSNHVLGIEMVLADGSVARIGASDGCHESPPLDLPGLVCGSEGTLGIITSLWVRLTPKATAFRNIVGIFATQADACRAISDIIAAGHLPAAMEMLDGPMVQIIEDAYHFGFPRDAAALVLTELDGVEDLLDEQMRQVIEIFRGHNPISVESSADPARRAALWKARKSAFGAIGKISRSYCTQDACVPRSMLADVLAEIGRIGRRYGLQLPNVFHAGDGNVHPIFLYDDRDQRQVQNTLAAAEEILRYCIDVGGALTGEHGVGVEKIHLMPYQFDRATMEQFQRVKAAFDPAQQFNAGKLLPSEKVRVTLLKPGRQAPQ